MVIGYNTKTPQSLYSYRHYHYGDDMHHHDCDGIEFHPLTDQPLMMVEAKHSNIKQIDLKDRQLIKLNNVRPDLPLIVLVCWHLNRSLKAIDSWTENKEQLLNHIEYYAIPVNQPAKKLLGTSRHMSELEYVQFLYQLRGMQMPTLQMQKPPCTICKSGICDQLLECDLPKII